MALIPIPRQPVLMKPFEERDYPCEPPAEFCSLYKTGDRIDLQMRQTPCGSNLVCNPDFEYGAEILTNGDFTGSASSWSLTNMTYSTNKIVHTAGAGIGTFAQSLGGIIAGQSYVVTIKVDVLTGGDITFNIYDGAFATISTVGTHVVTIIASTGAFNPDFHGLINNAVTAEIDYISVKTVDCWSFNTGFEISNGLACHIPGNADTLSEDIYSAVAAGDYVVLTYSIFGMSAGTVTVKIGGDTVRVVTQNGTYTDYVNTTLTDTLLAFECDADFDGCISPESSYELLKPSDISANLINAVTGNVVGVVIVTKNEDRLNFNYDTTDLPDGCYRIQVSDPCSSSLAGLSFSEINLDTDFTNAGVWITGVTISGTIDVNVTNTDEITAFVGAGPMVASTQFALQGHVFTPGTYIVKVELSITQWDGQNYTTLYLVLPTGASTTLYQLTPNFPASYPSIGLITQYYAVTINGTSNSFGLVFNNLPSVITDATNKSNYCSIKLAPYSGATPSFLMESNCLRVLSDVGDAQLVWGESDQDKALGFIFNANFPRIYSRLFLSFVNPHDSMNQGNYLYSTGLKKKTFAQLEGFYDLQFHEVDTNMHRTITAMLCSDHFRIGDSLTTYVEHICVEKNYEPNWPKKTPVGVAESVVEVARISSTVFN